MPNFANFRRKFSEDAPSGASIRKYYSDFKAKGCICKRKSTGCLPVGEATVERVTEFRTSPQKSTTGTGYPRFYFLTGWGTTPFPPRCQTCTE